MITLLNVSMNNKVKAGGSDIFKARTTPSFANHQSYFSSTDTSKVTVSPARGSSITPEAMTITGVAEGESVIQAHALNDSAYANYGDDEFLCRIEETNPVPVVATNDWSDGEYGKNYKYNTP